MASFKVYDIIDYNKIRTSGWALGDKDTGDIVVVRGIPALHDTFKIETAKNRLKSAVLNKDVVLTSAELIDKGTILCDVFVDEVNVANFFTDYV